MSLNHNKILKLFAIKIARATLYLHLIHQNIPNIYSGVFENPSYFGFSISEKNFLLSFLFVVIFHCTGLTNFQINMNKNNCYFFQNSNCLLFLKLQCQFATRYTHLYLRFQQFDVNCLYFNFFQPHVMH